ncbi:MAG: hypothetical protein WKF84_30125 [Pyrinomonadaceae bacterium]
MPVDSGAGESYLDVPQATPGPRLATCRCRRAPHPIASGAAETTQESSYDRGAEVAVGATAVISGRVQPT